MAKADVAPRMAVIEPHQGTNRLLLLCIHGSALSYAGAGSTTPDHPPLQAPQDQRVRPQRFSQIGEAL